MMDLEDFAEDITLLFGTMTNAQTLLTAVEWNAAAVAWFAHQSEEDQEHQNW